MLMSCRVNTLMIRSPWANLAILALNIIVFVLFAAELMPEAWEDHFVLLDWSPLGLIGHQFMHAGSATSSAT